MSNYGKSMTGKGAGKKQVNVTFSAKTPPTGPANGGKQVNPTVAAGKSQTAVDAHVKKQPVNRTYAAVKNESSKGKKPNNNAKPKSPAMKVKAKDTHTNQAPTTRNEMAPYAPNAKSAAPMSVKRLKSLGY